LLKKRLIIFSILKSQFTNFKKITDNILPAPLNSNKKSTNNTGGCPKKPIWRFFEQGDEINKGHYIATCLACKQSFRPGKATTMENI